jgi:glycosyltransferase involved in cell wall biosynthesis
METAPTDTVFDRLKCCVIIPTYNNGGTLEKVIRGVLAHTKNVIIVNDGSTDSTAEILKGFENVEIISYEKNRGKGYALKTAFKKATEKGFEYAITIDSDGQHEPADLHVFTEQIEKEPGILIVGSRNIEIENCPSKSKFANRFSNFWFNFFTDCKLTDTQSGYRLYPLKKINKLKFFSGKYEFEYEVLVKASWRNINIVTVPVNVFYPDKDKRITHFRPFWDFARISLLNLLFLFWTVVWIKPLKFLRNFNRRNIKAFIKDNILASKETNTKIVLSVMFGIFMGVVPIWGYQLITAIALAYVLHLNKPIVIVTANISIPPMLPVILYLSYITGGIVMGPDGGHVDSVSSMDFNFVKQNFYQYLIGSMVFAVGLSLAFGLITFLLLFFFRKKGRK